MNTLGKGRFKAYSAGSRPTGKVHPKAIETLKNQGIEPGDVRSKSWDEFLEADIDLVVTVCKNAAGESCPIFPGKLEKLSWWIPDPAQASGADTEIQAEFESAFFMLKDRIEDLVEGRLQAAEQVSNTRQYVT